MLSEEECRALAEQYLFSLAEHFGEVSVLIPIPFETSATAAYTYNTAKFVATGAFVFALAGNGPILVEQANRGG